MEEERQNEVSRKVRAGYVHIYIYIYYHLASIATTQGCRIFLEDILEGKSVERRFRLTSGWATGLPLLVLDGHKIIDGLLKSCL